MHEALDGVLASSEMDQIDRHVEQCAPCRDEYARLSEVVAAIRALPRFAASPDTAWDAIALRIAAPDMERADPDETPVIDLGARASSQGGTEPKRGQRIGAGIYLSLSQLAAAAAIVAIVSASIVWVGMNGGSAVPGVIATGPATSGGAAARAVSLEAGRYTEAVTALESILEEGRDVLAPQTLFTIEESLRAVDEAIADVEQALTDDPNSALLLRLLANQQRTKLGVLQRAADAVHART
jgi:tetratricopeptide (TPR) repeat protein